eukprot:m.334402 g.334402  ORF g.334402 m.334402 type:complete len:626 (-) comp27755_c0_seq1:83-1960(-)
MAPTSQCPLPTPSIPLTRTERRTSLVSCGRCCMGAKWCSGEVTLGTADTRPDPGHPIGNALRTLFLRSSVDLGTMVYTAPLFDSELDRLRARGGADNADDTSLRGTPSEMSGRVATAGSTHDTVTLIDRLQNVKAAVFDGTGVLTWRGEHVAEFWKRNDNVLRQKWQSRTDGPAVFADPTTDARAAAALAEFCTTVDSIADGPATMGTMLELEFDGTGVLTAMRTRTLQSSLLFLLDRMCATSQQHTPATATAAAIADFLGLVHPSALPDGSAALARLIYARIEVEMQRWSEMTVLARRHETVWRVIRQYRPAIATLVEFCPEWRRLSLPHGRPRYASCRHDRGTASAEHWPAELPQRGKGQATVIFDADVFEPMASDTLPGVHIPSYVRSMAAQGAGGECTIAPKSSCVVLLRRRAKDHATSLYLVAAVHLDSAPATNIAKVRTRRRQVRALLAEISTAVTSLASAGHCGVVLVGGDFNGERAEFVYGAGLPHDELVPAFASFAGGQGCPAPTDPSRGEPENGDGDGARLWLKCDGVDDGHLHEVAPQSSTTCTRAGTAVVIDFAFAGTFGFRQADAPCDVGVPHPTTTRDEVDRGSDPVDGTFTSILQFGSDHFPVAFDSDLL